MHVERADGSHHEEVRQDEGPTASPCAPEPAAQVGNEYANLDRERSGERLTDGNHFTHLIAAQPATALDQVAFHEPHECHRPPETRGSKPQEVPDELGHGPALQADGVQL